MNLQVNYLLFYRPQQNVYETNESDAYNVNYLFGHQVYFKDYQYKIYIYRREEGVKYDYIINCRKASEIFQPEPEFGDGRGIVNRLRQVYV